LSLCWQAAALALALRPLMQGTPTSVTDPAKFRALLAVERAQG